MILGREAPPRRWVFGIDRAKRWAFEDYDSGKTGVVSGNEIREDGLKSSSRSGAIPGSSSTGRPPEARPPVRLGTQP